MKSHYLDHLLRPKECDAAFKRGWPADSWWTLIHCFASEFEAVVIANAVKAGEAQHRLGNFRIQSLHPFNRTLWVLQGSPHWTPQRIVNSKFAHWLSVRSIDRRLIVQRSSAALTNHLSRKAEKEVSPRTAKKSRTISSCSHVSHAFLKPCWKPWTI